MSAWPWTHCFPATLRQSELDPRRVEQTFSMSRINTESTRLCMCSSNLLVCVLSYLSSKSPCDLYQQTSSTHITRTDTPTSTIYSIDYATSSTYAPSSPPKNAPLVCPTPYHIHMIQECVCRDSRYYAFSRAIIKYTHIGRKQNIYFTKNVMSICGLVVCVPAPQKMCLCANIIALRELTYNEKFGNPEPDDECVFWVVRNTSRSVWCCVCVRSVQRHGRCFSAVEQGRGWSVRLMLVVSVGKRINNLFGCSSSS